VLIEEIKLDLNLAEIMEKFKNDKYLISLESQMDPKKLGRYSFIMSEPFLSIKSKGSLITLEEGSEKRKFNGEPLKELDRLLKKYKIENNSHLPFIGGAVGYLSYDLCYDLEKIKKTVVDDVEIPDMFFGFYDYLIAVDHLEDKKYLIALGLFKKEENQIRELKSKLANRVEEKEVFLSENVVFEKNMTKEEYVNSIERVKDYIVSGDIYQINFTQRFSCNLNKSPFALYKRLRETNPAPFSSYIDFGEGKIVSSSPERFIKVRDGVIETRPIKGTMARGKTVEEDRENRKILENSEKDRSELLMIVDLERNDLGKVSETGTVNVTELFQIEEYATVFQQVSTIEGKLKKEIGLEELLKATFPGGSITGAPKIRAMEVIDELETTSRNIYTGSIGYFGFDGNLDLNIVIRTVLCKDDRAYFQVGGGIVWDSTAESEYEESLLKGRALKEALLWKG